MHKRGSCLCIRGDRILWCHWIGEAAARQGDIRVRCCPNDGAANAGSSDGYGGKEKRKSIFHFYFVLSFILSKLHDEMQQS